LIRGIVGEGLDLGAILATYVTAADMARAIDRASRNR
jgi:hypothetical protein